MKYHVAFQRMAWRNYTVEAESLEEAEDLAWEELDSDEPNSKKQEWLIESINKEEN